MTHRNAIRIGILGAALLLLATGAAFGQNTLDVVRSSGGVGTTQPIDADCVDEGNFGLRVTATAGNNNATFVQAGSSVGFNDETTFRATFRFKPADMDIPLNTRFFLMASTPGTRQTGAIVGTQAPFRLAFFKNPTTGERKVNFACKANCSTPGTCPSAITQKITLGDDTNSDQWNTIQIEWAHNDAGVFNGVCRISLLDGPLAPQVENSTASYANRQYSVRAIKLGINGGNQIPAASNGKMCIDDFQSFRTLAP